MGVLGKPGIQRSHFSDLSRTDCTAFLSYLASTGTRQRSGEG